MRVAWRELWQQHRRSLYELAFNSFRSSTSVEYSKVKRERREGGKNKHIASGQKLWLNNFSPWSTLAGRLEKERERYERIEDFFEKIMNGCRPRVCEVCTLNEYLEEETTAGSPRFSQRFHSAAPACRAIARRLSYIFFSPVSRSVFTTASLPPIFFSAPSSLLLFPFRFCFFLSLPQLSSFLFLPSRFPQSLR